MEKSTKTKRTPTKPSSNIHLEMQGLDSLSLPGTPMCNRKKRRTEFPDDDFMTGLQIKEKFLLLEAKINNISDVLTNSTYLPKPPTDGWRDPGDTHLDFEHVT